MIEAYNTPSVTISARIAREKRLALCSLYPGAQRGPLCRHIAANHGSTGTRPVVAKRVDE